MTLESDMDTEKELLRLLPVQTQALPATVVRGRPRAVPQSEEMEDLRPTWT